MAAQAEHRTGLLYGFGAYGLWGLMPLYWHLLESTGATEVLGHRMVWALPVAVAMLAVAGRWSWIGPLVRDPRRLALVVVAATVISVNWGLFIWSVTVGRVLEASLGYFINPLVSIAFGVLLLRERLRPTQWVAVGMGVSAVVVMAVAYGRLPWVSLVLAFSFATYGLVKKRIRLDGVEGFTAETAVLFLPAAGYLVFLASRGESTFLAEGPGHTLLLAVSGLATAIPLVLFGAAAVRLPLSTVGLLQYLAPASMFVLGVLAFHEEMPAERLAGFALVWLALAVLTTDALRQARRSRVAARAVARAGGAGRPAPVVAEPAEAAGELAQLGGESVRDEERSG
ncbi:EamA family transporter RarD [Streptomyces sp. NPDC005438]|uniref:EamA family transporter RarD n=1 Tax=Streptomyces sp. NPDC005438 TaxID=3156880 RepID=UPI00339F7E34